MAVCSQIRSLDFWDSEGNRSKFSYLEDSSIFDLPQKTPLVLHGVDRHTLLFVLPCKLWNPSLSSEDEKMLESMLTVLELPRHLGFMFYDDYKVYFVGSVTTTRLHMVRRALKKTKNTVSNTLRKLIEDRGVDIVPIDTKVACDESEKTDMGPPESWIYDKYHNNGEPFHYTFPDHKILLVTWMFSHQENRQYARNSHNSHREDLQNFNPESFFKHFEIAALQTLKTIAKYMGLQLNFECYNH